MGGGVGTGREILIPEAKSFPVRTTHSLGIIKRAYLMIIMQYIYIYIRVQKNNAL